MARELVVFPVHLAAVDCVQWCAQGLQAYENNSVAASGAFSAPASAN